MEIRVRQALRLYVLSHSASDIAENLTFLDEVSVGLDVGISYKAGAQAFFTCAAAAKLRLVDVEKHRRSHRRLHEQLVFRKPPGLERPEAPCGARVPRRAFGLERRSEDSSLVAGVEGVDPLNAASLPFAPSLESLVWAHGRHVESWPNAHRHHAPYHGQLLFTPFRLEED